MQYVDHTGEMPSEALIEDMERVIRDFAEQVTGAIENRRSRSYGLSKSAIKNTFAKMDGAIGMYMVLTRQSGYAGSPTTAKFTSENTTTLVHEARHQMGLGNF